MAERLGAAADLPPDRYIAGGPELAEETGTDQTQQGGEGAAQGTRLPSDGGHRAAIVLPRLAGGRLIAVGEQVAKDEPGRIGVFTTGSAIGGGRVPWIAGGSGMLGMGSTAGGVGMIGTWPIRSGVAMLTMGSVASGLGVLEIRPLADGIGELKLRLIPNGVGVLMIESATSGGLDAFLMGPSGHGPDVIRKVLGDDAATRTGKREVTAEIAPPLALFGLLDQVPLGGGEIGEKEGKGREIEPRCEVEVLHRLRFLRAELAHMLEFLDHRGIAQRQLCEELACGCIVLKRAVRGRVP